MVVVFVAIRTREIAAAHGNDVGQNGVVPGNQTLGDHPQFADAPADPLGCLAEPFGSVRHTSENPLITTQRRRYAEWLEAIGAEGGSNGREVALGRQAYSDGRNLTVHRSWRSEHHHAAKIRISQRASAAVPSVRPLSLNPSTAK